MKTERSAHANAAIVENLNWLEAAFGNTAPIPRADEERLIARFKAGDAHARDELVRVNSRFIAQVATGYTTDTNAFGDLYNVGVIGFLTGMDRFDPASGNKLISYAIWWIRQALTDYTKQNANAVRRPYNMHRHAKKVTRAIEALRAEGVRRPSHSEVAKKAGVSAQAVEDVMSPHVETSLDAHRGRPTDEGDTRTLLDTLGTDTPSPLDELIEGIEGTAIEDALDALSPRERDVVCKYFGVGAEEHSLVEIGAEYGISRERVRQIRNHAIEKLRRTLVRTLPAEAVLAVAVPSRRQDHIRRLADEGHPPQYIAQVTQVEPDLIGCVLAA